MKKTLLTAILCAAALAAGAQTADDPVLMTINGKDVTRAEFEYSFHKNGNVEGAVETKTLDEYVPMFVNYKLKVAAAEAARYDTLQSFRQEFRTYRDMQLTPYLVDTAYIDSIARVVYDNTVRQLDGSDLIQTSHILIRLSQNATDTEKTAAKAKADSIRLAIAQGADFAETAKKHSADGSARNGGKLPFVGPGQFVKEYETAAYSLQPGEVSQPVLSPFGYHIIRMDQRKQLEPYDTLRPQIIAMLKRQNIEEQSSENRINQIIARSGGRLTRDAVLDSVMQAHIDDNPSLRYLIQEYYDGLLLFEVSKREVWDTAAADTEGLQRWYKAHKKDYAWTEPRFKGFVYHCKDPNQAKAVRKMLKKHAEGDWRKQLKQQFNKDSVTVSVSGPYLCKKGENPFVDKYAFKDSQAKPRDMKGYALSGTQGKIMKQPKSYLDVKAQVTADYQAHKEQLWVEELNRRFPVTINREVLQTIR